MNLSKIFSTTAALGALVFSMNSSAIPISLTVNAGVDTYTVSGNDGLAFVAGSLIAVPLEGWALETNTVFAGDLADPYIFSLNTSATQNVLVPATTLTVTAIASGFTDLESFSAHFTSIGANTSDIDYSIDGGASWIDLAAWNSAINANSNNLYNLGVPSGAFDLRITQVFTTNGTGVASAVGVPEPSIIALFGLGFVGLGIASRRRRSK